MIKERLKTSLSRQDSYADLRRRPLEFSNGDMKMTRSLDFSFYAWIVIGWKPFVWFIWLLYVYVRLFMDY